MDVRSSLIYLFILLRWRRVYDILLVQEVMLQKFQLDEEKFIGFPGWDYGP